MRKTLFGLLALCCAAVAGPAERAFAGPFAPAGEWYSLDFDFELVFKLDEGKVLFCELYWEEGDGGPPSGGLRRGRTVERRVAVVRQSGHFLHLALDGEEGTPGNPGACLELTRLNDDALVYAAGCTGGVLMIRSYSGLGSNKYPFVGRFGFPEEDGTFSRLIDFDKGLFIINGKELPMKTNKPSDTEWISLEAGGMEFSAYLLGYDPNRPYAPILEVRMRDEKTKTFMPPFGLVAIPPAGEINR